MPRFAYTGRAAAGPVSGELDGSDAGAVAALLMARGVTPLNIDAAGGAAEAAGSASQPVQLPAFLQPKVLPADLMLFSRQLHTLLRAGVPGWPGIARWMRLGAGLLLIALAWWAMVQARVQGVELLLSIMALVWTADIAAYFGGRAFGRRKLAPSISPGKSWAGVYSGVAGVLLLAAVWTWAELHYGTSGASLYGRLWAMGPLAMLGGLLLLTAMSVCGDLIESLVKRSAGVKDSSQLLPGHGGVLDRVDALLPVLPLAMMLATF